jgi:TRAP-type C4-dicarboxylate transport system permease small subunit
MPIMSTSTRETLERIGNAGVNVLRVIAGTLLTCLMLLTAADVVMRYIFNSPIRGSFELAELLVALLMFSGFPLVSINNQHVCIDLLDSFFSPTVSRIIDFCSGLICIAIFAGMGLLLLRKASRMTLTGDVTIALNIPLIPVVYVMFGFVLLTAFVQALKCLSAYNEEDHLPQRHGPSGGPTV